MKPIRLGISSCLLGEEVRWDAGHKRDHFLTDTLGRFVEWVPVCPEVELGLSTPREPIRLVGVPEAPRLISRKSGEDLTARMRTFARRRARELAGLDLCGYVLKKDSPSCGMERVKVHPPPDAAQGPGVNRGVGLFARALMDEMPILPVEEEGRLNDPGLRENFIERVFTYRRWRDLVEGRWSVRSLIDFHTDHKLQVMAHSPTHYTQLGRLVAAAKGRPKAELQREYGAGLMESLAKPATVQKNTNVLFHTLGYFKKVLDPTEKEQLIGTIESYHRGLVPLIVPVTLVQHLVGRFGQEYLARQVYLSPHPLELMLRNHA